MIGEDGTTDEVDRERQIVDLLSRAVQLSGNERRRFLDGACADDPDLRADLEAMLDEGAITEEFLATPAVGQLKVLATRIHDTGDASGEEQPRWIGPYRVVGNLGQGGMGKVYLAEQEEPVRRRVALKVLEAIHDLHDPQRLQRFAAECQALARLHHPNVASLYEVGTTDEKHPYVAMEPVDGTEILEWCDQRRLSIRQRLELFLGVCAGVRHAHEKGILHRDLKPANVLVTEIDGRPSAKVIDFGIARALDDPLHSGNKPVTLEHQIVGSPAYMCPEVASGKRDIDTRSDVYGLGLLLYELLVGERPFPAMPNLGLVLRQIITEAPPIASSRYVELAAERRQEIAAARSLPGPRQVLRRLRGDLDAILAKSLARDPEERYSSPSDLASELRRHLEMRPVEVRASSASYRSGRFVRRHFPLVTSAVVVAGALVAGIVGTTREARRANMEAERANHEAVRAREALEESRKLSSFLVELFEVADPERNPGEPVDVHQLLERGAERLRGELPDQPLVRALLLHTIGEIYTKMALFEPAEALVSEALEIRERELDSGHPDILKSVNQLGVTFRRQGRLDEAELLLRRVLEARESASELDTVALAVALNNLGNLLFSQKKYPEAEAIQRRALAIRELALEPDDPDLAETLNNLGAALQAQGKYEDSLPILEQAAQKFLELLGPEHPRYAATLYNLSLVEEELYRWSDAEAHCRQATDLWQKAYGVTHPRATRAQARLAHLLREQGRYAESIQIYEAMLRKRREAGLDTTLAVPEVRRLLRGLAASQGLHGEVAAAEATFRRVLSHYLETRGKEDRSTAIVRANLAWLVWRRGDFAGAEAAHRQVLEIRRRILEPEDAAIGSTLYELALAVADQGRDREASSLLQEALGIFELEPNENQRMIASVQHELGRSAERSGRSADARRRYRSALEIRQLVLPSDHPDLRQSEEALASLDTQQTAAAE